MESSSLHLLWLKDGLGCRLRQSLLLYLLPSRLRLRGEVGLRHRGVADERSCAIVGVGSVGPGTIEGTGTVKGSHAVVRTGPVKRNHPIRPACAVKGSGAVVRSEVTVSGWHARHGVPVSPGDAWVMPVPAGGGVTVPAREAVGHLAKSLAIRVPGAVLG